MVGRRRKTGTRSRQVRGAADENKEANEFIVYWLPLMKGNPYNLIAFQSDSYTQTAQLSIEPAPDTLLRVFMAWKPLESAVDISAQNLTAPVRTGFTAVEWGGCQVR